MNKWIPYPRFLIRKNIIKSILKNEDLSGKKGLEIGFGSGEMLLYFVGRNLEMAGFDESELANSVAKERLLQQNRKVDLYKSFREIPKNKFDYIFAFEVLEHIKDDSAALDSWLSLLKVNGKIIISIPAHQHRFGVMDLSVGHYRRYDRNNLLDLLKSKGVHIINFWNYGFPIINLLESISNLLSMNKKRNDFNQKEMLSYKSFEASNKFFIRLISNDIVMFPFYCLQNLFLKSDLSSGYILLAQKKEKQG
jgi:SAM-dependent methyltransferase